MCVTRCLKTNSPLSEPSLSERPGAQIGWHHCTLNTTAIHIHSRNYITSKNKWCKEYKYTAELKKWMRWGCFDIYSSKNVGNEGNFCQFCAKCQFPPVLHKIRPWWIFLTAACQNPGNGHRTLLVSRIRFFHISEYFYTFNFVVISAKLNRETLQ